MAKVEIEDPVELKRQKVDDRGRVYVGTAYSGQRVRIAVELLDDEDE